MSDAFREMLGLKEDEYIDTSDLEPDLYDTLEPCVLAWLGQPRSSRGPWPSEAKMTFEQCVAAHGYSSVEEWHADADEAEVEGEEYGLWISSKPPVALWYWDVAVSGLRFADALLALGLEGETPSLAILASYDPSSGVKLAAEATCLLIGLTAKSHLGRYQSAEEITDGRGATIDIIVAAYCAQPIKLLDEFLDRWFEKPGAEDLLNRYGKLLRGIEGDVDHYRAFHKCYKTEIPPRLSKAETEALREIRRLLVDSIKVIQSMGIAPPRMPDGDVCVYSQAVQQWINHFPDRMRRNLAPLECALGDEIAKIVFKDAPFKNGTVTSSSSFSPKQAQHPTRTQERLVAHLSSGDPYLTLDGVRISDVKPVAVYYVAELIDANGHPVAFKPWLQGHPEFEGAQSDREKAGMPLRLRGLIKSSRGCPARLDLEALAKLR